VYESIIRQKGVLWRPPCASLESVLKLDFHQYPEPHTDFLSVGSGSPNLYDEYYRTDASTEIVLHPYPETG
jgi:hypothetical protein